MKIFSFGPADEIWSSSLNVYHSNFGLKRANHQHHVKHLKLAEHQPHQFSLKELSEFIYRIL